jgi:hypothetical protein
MAVAQVYWEGDTGREGGGEKGNLGFLAAVEGLYRLAMVGGVDLDRRGRGGGSGGLPSATELLHVER